MTVDRDTSPPLRLWLVRHGRTLFNERDLAQGWCDSPLTEEGRAGVAALAENLRDVPWVGAYSSTSERAADTAEIIIGDRVEIVRDRRWKEFNFGLWEARPNRELFEELRRLAGAELDPRQWLRGLYFGDFPSLPGGETGAAFGARVREAIAAIRRSHPSGDVLVATHGMTLGVAIASVYPAYEFWRGPANATFAVLEYPESGAPTLRAVGARTPQEVGVPMIPSSGLDTSSTT